MSRLTLVVATLGVATMLTSPAIAREKQITPYIEIGQILTADLNNGDVLTYSTVAVGIDASIQSRRAEAQISYRYERRIAWNRGLTDQDVHTGLARGSYHIAPSLSVEGGAIATRARADIRGAAPGVLNGNVDNISQIYSVYAGPTLATNVGPVGINASYRYGFTKVESPGFTGVPAGQPRLDVFDTSQTQVAQASASLKSGVILPVGITVSAGWQREDASQLDQVYDGKFARADVIWPVLPTLALTAGAGYEKIIVGQRDPARNAAGQPIIDAAGRFTSLPGAPRRIAYNFDGIYYDAGVIWRPNSRTMVEARAGQRYGSFSFTGSLSYQAANGVAVQVGVYDGIQTFGRQLQAGIVGLPTSFNANSGPFGGQFNGCVFGAEGAAAGDCLNGALQSISTSAFRSRGIDAVLSVNRGATTFGVGAGYARRSFVAPIGGSIINGITDQSYYVQAFLARALDRRTSVDANIFANYFESGIAGAPAVFGAGATGSLSRSFGRLSAIGSVGVFTFAQERAPTNVTVQALLGARYQF